MWLWSYFTVVILIVGAVTSTDDEAGHFLNEFAIQLHDGSRELAESIAKEHGFIVKREIPSIKAFVLEHPNVHHRSKRSADNEVEFLKNDKRVKHAQQEVTLKRVKRRIVYDKQLELPIRNIDDDSLYDRYDTKTQRDNIVGMSVSFSDPKFKDMWYLINQGQSGGEEGLDMNVAVVWQNGITGKGVVVCILDDGIDHTHPDLRDNYDPEASADLNDKDDKANDPMPDTSDADNSHGTRCAGEIAAAANNNVCGVGVAYDAHIGGVRILDGSITDSLEAEALTFNNNYIDIYSASWGPSDDGATLEGPRHLALQAIQHGTQNGRNGLGSIFVWATGNGGMNKDDCSADGYVSLPETLSVGSVTDWGTSPFFMENCSSTLAVVPSGGEEYFGQERHNNKVKLKVVTTDMNGGCIENFQGTSSAAPLAAGCLANVLQANPHLTWRDVQHIVVHGSRVPSADSSWTINGAGLHVSHRFGFGLMDCGKMVELAQSWNSVPEQLTCNTTKSNYQIVKRKSTITDSMVIDGCGSEETQSIDRLEHVQVHVKMATKRRGDTILALVSPAGTRSILLSPRVNDKHDGEWEFTFMTVHNWGESPVGRWDLEITHVPSERVDISDDSMLDDELEPLLETLKTSGNEQRNGDPKNPFGYIKEWSLVLHGTHGTRHDRTEANKDRTQKASYPTEKDVSEIKKREFELSKKVNVKRAQPVKDRRNQVQPPYKANDDDTLNTLWSLLHKNGGRELRKRVLASSRSSSHSQGNMLEINELVDDILDLLEERIHQKRENKQKYKR